MADTENTPTPQPAAHAALRAAAAGREADPAARGSRRRRRGRRGAGALVAGRRTTRRCTRAWPTATSARSRAQLDSAERAVRARSRRRAALLVPADRKYEVRMQLASAGLPRGAGFGIEEMPERSSFGQTPFMENALYVRAVETELARTIGSMQPVEIGARASRAAAAVGVLAAEARAERVRDAEAVLGTAARRRAGASPSCISSRRACPISCRRASRSSIKAARC